MNELEELDRLQEKMESMMSDASPARRPRAKAGMVIPVAAEASEGDEAEGEAGATVLVVESGAEDASDSPTREQTRLETGHVTDPSPLLREILAKLDNLPEGIVAALRAGGVASPVPGQMADQAKNDAGGRPPMLSRWLRRGSSKDDDQAFQSPVEPVPQEPQDSPEVQQRRQDAAALLQAVEDRVFSHAMTHHSSVVAMIGWAFALLSLGAGMAWGYISAVAHFPPWWPKPDAGVLASLASTFLGAPVGILLLPISGFIVWRIGAEEPRAKKKRVGLLKLLGALLIMAGVTLPFVGML